MERFVKFVPFLPHLTIIKVIKDSKRKNQKKIHFFLNSFSVDEIDNFSELLLVLLVLRQKNKIIQR